MPSDGLPEIRRQSGELPRPPRVDDVVDGRHDPTDRHSLRWRVVRSRALGPGARWLSHRVAAAPRWSPFRVLGPVRAQLRGEIGASRLLHILEVLEDAGVRYWLAGGWGVDALVGRQTRRHDDADLLLDDFDRSAPLACTALAPLGFTLVQRNRQPVWMPDQWVVADESGITLDLVSLSWERLRAAFPDPVAPRDVFAVGSVGGRPVPCLSASVQRLFHSGFELRHVHRRDLALLSEGRPAGPPLD